MSFANKTLRSFGARRASHRLGSINIWLRCGQAQILTRTLETAPYFLRVFAAFFAAREREAADLFLAAPRACRESARFEAALRPSRFNARVVARERFADFLAAFFFPFFRSRAACLRVFFDPFLGGGKSTPARRALERPMAIACLAERAPCSPSRTCSISSRTNSPACVLGAFPSSLSSFALSRVSFSGIGPPFKFLPSSTQVPSQPLTWCGLRANFNLPR